MEITIPDFCLLLLVGISGSGKTSFARKHFQATEILSSDFFRAMISDDENDQTATPVAFSALHYLAGCRLARRKLTVIDATNLQANARRPLIHLARQHHCPIAAIVFNLPENLAHERNRAREGRRVEERVLNRQQAELEHALPRLGKEGYHPLYWFETAGQVEAATIARRPLSIDHRADRGPFDIIGDVHGCYDELRELLEKLGYSIAQEGSELTVAMPPGRKLVFLGDLVDRGPKSPEVLHLVMGAVQAGQAYAVPGNHDDKLMRHLLGRVVQVAYGLEDTIRQMAYEPPGFDEQVLDFLQNLPNYLWLDLGRLVVAHAGLLSNLIGRDSPRVREFVLYGQTSGDLDEFGLPQRLNWAREYHDPAKVVYGHTPVGQPHWLNNTINIDTGCIYGGALSALRYPELEIVSVPAHYIYAHTKRDFLVGKPVPPPFPQSGPDPEPGP